MKKPLVTFALSLSLSLPLSGVAAAQGDAQKTALAQSLFEQADAAMKEKKFDEACPKLERVVTLVPEGVGARMTLAECYEGAGKLASAFGTYVGAEGAARKQNQEDRAQLARQKMDALKARVALLTLEVPDEVKKAPGFALKRDGADVSDAEFGGPVAVDKGEHVVIATATGRAPWETKVTVKDGEKPVIKVELGAASTVTDPNDPNKDPKKDPNKDPDKDPGKPAPQGEGSFFSPLRIVGLAGGIAGLGLVGGGIGAGLAGKSVYDDTNDSGVCSADTDLCTTKAGVDDRAKAVKLGLVGTGLVIGGAVIGAAGVVLFIVAPSSPPDDAPAAKTGVTNIRVGAAPGFMTLSGQFY